jgi:hypothetical protein
MIETSRLQEVPFEAHFTPAIEAGWRLTPAAWGNGYATEGARAAIDYAFKQLDRNEVVAITAKINVRSQMTSTIRDYPQTIGSHATSFIA